MAPSVLLLFLSMFFTIPARSEEPCTTGKCSATSTSGLALFQRPAAKVRALHKMHRDEYDRLEEHDAEHYVHEHDDGEEDDDHLASLAEENEHREDDDHLASLAEEHEADGQKDSKNDISFRLYELSDDSKYQAFGYDKLEEIKISPNKPTKISIHGNGGDFDIDHMFADAYFSAGEDVNLVGVDWRVLSDKIKFRAPTAGEAVADMIAHLIDQGQTTLDNIHLICFSWGCQVSGWASRYLRERGIGLIPRLSATDPGKNAFDKKKPNERMSSDDAQLVDVIHSNTGNLGWEWPVGHVDFYPNGGDGLFRDGQGQPSVWPYPFRPKH
jgi:hypothetical protein